MWNKSLINLKKPKADIRNKYLINLQVGFVATLVILNFMFRVNFNPESEVNFEERAQEIIEMEDIVMTQQEFTPPPPERPSTPVPVPNDEIVEDDFFDLDTEFDMGDAMSAPPPPPPPSDDDEDEPEIFTFVEDMPEIVGGLDEIYKNLRYPEIARRAGIEGRVVVQFVIDERGNTSNHQVVRGIGGGADEAAIEAIKKVNFTPGRQRGRPVRVSYTLTIVFQLSDAN